MKKSLMIILLSLVYVSVFAQEGKIRSGVIAGVSMNQYQDKLFPTSKAWYSLPDKMFSFHAGYQFQFQLKHRLSVDASLLYGQKQGKIVSSYGIVTVPGYKDKFSRHYIAMGGVINYNLIGGLKIGVGIEPTLHFKERILVENEIKPAFDIPVVAKLAYSFKHCDIALMYKHGVCNVARGLPDMKSARTRDLQLSVFIPIFK